MIFTYNIYRYHISDLIYTDRYRYIETDRQTDSQTARQTDRFNIQMYIYTDMILHISYIYTDTICRHIYSDMFLHILCTVYS